MKKLLLLALFAMIMVGCEEKDCNCSSCKEINEQLLRKVVHEEVDSILIDIFD